MGSSKKILDGVIWTYANAIITSVYGFISVPLLLNYFGKASFGLIALAMSLNVYLGLMDLGISGTTVRFFSTWLAEDNKEKVKKLFSTSIYFLGCIGLINACILFIFGVYCDRVFDLTTDEVTMLRYLIGILGLNAFFSWATSPFDQIIRSGENVAWLQKRSLYPISCQIIILILTLSLKWSLPVYFFLSTFSYLFIVPLTIRKIKKTFPYVSFVPKFDKLIFREILSYSISIFSFGIFQFSMLNLRPIILGVQSGVESVADYKVLAGIVGMVLTVSSCFFSVMLPSSTKAVAQGNKDALDKIVYDGTKYVTIVLSLMIFGGVVVGDSLLRIYVGDSFSNLSIWLIVWLLSLFVQHNQPISTIIFAGTNVKPIAYISAFSTLVGLSSGWLLSPIYHVGGVVIGYLLYCISQILFYYIYYWPRVLKINSVRVLFCSFIPPVVAGLISSLVALFALSLFCFDAKVMFLVGGFAYVLIFAIITFVFVLNRNDKHFFLYLIKRKS